MIFLQRKIFYYYKEQLSVYFQYVALFGFEQEGILIGFMRIAEGNLEMLFITNKQTGILKMKIKYSPPKEVMANLKTDGNFLEEK